jgi:acyl-CoA thioester hydrolase
MRASPMPGSAAQGVDARGVGAVRALEFSPSILRLTAVTGGGKVNALPDSCVLYDMDRPSPESRSQYRHFLQIPTRWADNDAYGHVNNTVYYSYFDTAVNRCLIDAGVLDPVAGEVIGLVVETHCSYFSELSFPDRVDAGLRVARIGNSSVRYEIGLFRNDETHTSARGHFVHVYVDRIQRRPVALPLPLREVLQRLTVA